MAQTINPENFTAGVPIQDMGGIFLAWYDPQADTVANERSVTHDVALFVSPTDIKNADGKTNLCLTFNHMVDVFTSLTGFFGHDGEKLKPDVPLVDMSKRCLGNVRLTPNQKLSYWATLVALFSTKEPWLNAYDSLQPEPNGYGRLLKKRLRNLQDGESTGWLLGTSAMVEKQYGYRNNGAFAGTYCQIAPPPQDVSCMPFDMIMRDSRGTTHPYFYWSSSTLPEGFTLSLIAVGFHERVSIISYQEDQKYSARPIRAHRFALQG